MEHRKHHQDLNLMAVGARISQLAMSGTMRPNFQLILKKSYRDRLIDWTKKFKISMQCKMKQPVLEMKLKPNESAR
jgi:hypothetical protein